MLERGSPSRARNVADMSDRMQVSTQDPTGKESAREPPRARHGRALRRVMAGELPALNEIFGRASGDEHDWVQLTPRDQDVARRLRQIDLQGAGRRLSVIVIVESEGDRTTTRLQYPE